MLQTKGGFDAIRSRIRVPKGRVFWRLTLSFLLVLLIPLIIGSIAFQSAIQVIERESGVAALTMLESYRDSFDGVSLLLYRNAMTISSNYTIMQAQHLEEPQFGSSSAIKPYLTLNALDVLQQNPTLNASYYVLFDKNESVISPTSFAFGFEPFYERELKRVYDGLTYQDWTAAVMADPPHSGFFALDPKQDVLTAAYPLPINAVGKRAGTVIYILQGRQFVEPLRKLLEQSEGYLSILDAEGRVLLGYGAGALRNAQPNLNVLTGEGYESMDYEGRSMIAVHARSGSGALGFLLLLPRDVVMAEVYEMNRLFMLILCAILLIGIMVIYLMSYGNYKPVRDIASMFEARGSKQRRVDEFDVIRTNISSLMTTNEQMSEAVQKQVEVLHSLHVYKLLTDGYSSREEVTRYFLQDGVDMSRRFFMAVCIHLSLAESADALFAQKGLDVVRAHIAEYASQNAAGHAYVTVMDDDRVAVLCHSDSDRFQQLAADAEALIDGLLKELKSCYPIEVAVGVGRLGDELIHIAQSYRESVVALDYADSNAMDVCWYKDIQRAVQGYYYPLNVEAQLGGFVRSGDEEELHELLRAVWIKNQRAAPRMQRQLIDNMRCSVLRLMEDSFDLPVKEGDRLGALMDQAGLQPYPDAFEAMEAVFDQLCAHSRLKRQGSQADAIRAIEDHLKQNYTDQNLSLKGISSEFGMSESYFSQYFKEHLSENFSSYVENLRIAEALRLLRETDQTVEAISERVGYANVRTFRRAFKKLTGVAPSECRNS